jgi:hypothetical protein
MALGFAQPLTEISTRKCFWVAKADNLTAIFETIVEKVWEFQYLTNL